MALPFYGCMGVVYIFIIETMFILSCILLMQVYLVISSIKRELTQERVSASASYNLAWFVTNRVNRGSDPLANNIIMEVDLCQFIDVF